MLQRISRSFALVIQQLGPELCNADFKYEENSVKAVQCLNELVTNALLHAEDCLQYLSALKDFDIFRFCPIPQIMAIATLALCYNNLEVFRGVVKMQRGLAAKVMDQTRTMSDVYGAFYEFSSLLKSNVLFYNKVLDSFALVCCIFNLSLLSSLRCASDFWIFVACLIPVSLLTMDSWQLILAVHPPILLVRCWLIAFSGLMIKFDSVSSVHALLAVYNACIIVVVCPVSAGWMSLLLSSCC